MKIFTLVIGLWLWSAQAIGSCGTTSCYDYCTGSYITVHGNTCDTAYDYNRGCYAAYGYCANSSGGNSCAGQTTSCYDYCTGSYITVQGDTCESAYDYNRGCYAAHGSCSR